MPIDWWMNIYNTICPPGYNKEQALRTHPQEDTHAGTLATCWWRQRLVGYIHIKPGQGLASVTGSWKRGQGQAHHSCWHSTTRTESQYVFVVCYPLCTHLLRWPQDTDQPLWSGTWHTHLLFMWDVSRLRRKQDSATHWRKRKCRTLFLQGRNSERGGRVSQGGSSLGPRAYGRSFNP